jgi:hypothetical protein
MAQFRREIGKYVDDKEVTRPESMHDQPERQDEALSADLGWAVYQCVNGCVHLRFQNLTLTFAPPEFAMFAQLVGEAYVRLGVRSAVAAVGPH